MESGASWLNADDRRKAVSAIIQAASTFVGPAAPLVVWGVEWAIDHRQQIYDALGQPLRAYASDLSTINLSRLSYPGLHRQAELSITATITGSTRRIGLQDGDPVTFVLSGHSYRHARSGLVVPARIGETVQLSIPPGPYALTALGSRREDLFAARDPFTSVAGSNVLVAGRQQVGMGLERRASLMRSGNERRPIPLLAFSCIWCAKPMGGGNLLAHLNICPNRPRFESARISFATMKSYLTWSADRSVVYQCPNCPRWFRSQVLLEAHTSWERMRSEVQVFLDRL